ncbi:hypothetical protein M2282_006153 [Variovorax boronicumulans]|uniref:hypothetical protein n=1 Tax=Variovorax boronicumulans TaxID=436515 RepID=UPI002476AD61|nr:hypothetical protein [Variovorax boronicumulans]MDH6170973.1 hypothetical protein [Variovorax boronicumulans]
MKRPMQISSPRDLKRYATRFALVLVVAALHGLMIGFLSIASKPGIPAAADVQRIAVHLIAVEPPNPPTKPALPPTSSPVPSTARALGVRARTRPDIAPAVRRDASSIAATEPAAPVTPDLPSTAQPRPLDLNSEATRRALRDMDKSRPRSFAEQANSTLGNTPGSSLDSRLGAGIAAARRGDCQRGEFKPWAVDVGLGPEYKLSLPGVVRALADGECAALSR